MDDADPNLSKLRSSFSLFKVGLVERSRAYPSFRLKFLSVRRGQKSNPEIWRKWTKEGANQQTSTNAKGVNNQ